MTDKNLGNNYNRRKVLRLAGFFAGASVLPGTINAISNKLLNGSSAVQNATPITHPDAAVAVTPPSQNVTRVVLVRTADRISGTRKAIDLLQPEGIFGQTVFIKPNYNTADPAPAATNTNLLRTLVQELKRGGAGQITVGDRSGMAVTRNVMETKGLFQLAQTYGLNTVVFDEMDADGWQYFPAPGSHWQNGFAIARPVLNAGAVVNTCCLKTHARGGGFTLSLKNAVGMVAKYYPGNPYNYMQELHRLQNPYRQEMIAEINAFYQPTFVLLDGVDAFISGGPELSQNSTLAPTRVIIAGTDRVAVDAVGLAILRWAGSTSPDVTTGSIWALKQISRAVELGLGVGSPEQIEFVTPDIKSQRMVEQIREWLY